MARILLMTATVAPPPNARDLQRVDPALRLQDYATSLRFYIGQLEAGVVDAIVFSNNSDSDISTLIKIGAASPKADRVEFLSFQGLDHPPEYGRGYGELKLVDYTMAHSAIIRDAAPDDVVWKVTGRYIVENLGPLVRKVRPDAVLYCHCRNHPMRWIEMFLMGWKKQAHKAVFAGALDVTRESEVNMRAEEAVRLLIDERALSMPIQRRLAAPPRIVGVRGYDNASYENQRMKRLVRALAARMLPWLWL